MVLARRRAQNCRAAVEPPPPTPWISTQSAERTRPAVVTARQAVR